MVEYEELLEDSAEIISDSTGIDYISAVALLDADRIKFILSEIIYAHHKAIAEIISEEGL